VPARRAVNPDWTTAAALERARACTPEAWIDAYLAAGSWAHPGLRDGLRRQRRWWRGPPEVALADLPRVCGPEPDVECPQDPVAQEDDVELAASTYREHAAWTIQRAAINRELEHDT
jgi:hypothetical protein